MGVAGLSFLETAAYIEILSPKADYGHWLAFGVTSLIIIGRLIYLSSMYYIPCLLDKSALELDGEKFQCFITGKLLFQIPPGTVYWKDIDDIEYISPPRIGGSIGGRNGAILDIRMKDGSAAGISTKNISCDDKEIYDTMMNYFKNHHR